MKRLALVAAFFLAMFGSATAAEIKAGALTIDNIWARASIGGATGAFLSVHNSGEADRLLSISSPATDAVQLHTTFKDGDVMKMRPLDGLDVPAKGKVELQPGGNHIMVMGLKTPLKAGDKLALTLHFAKAGAVDVVAAVQKPGASAPAAEPDRQMPDHQHMH